MKLLVLVLVCMLLAPSALSQSVQSIRDRIATVANNKTGDNDWAFTSSTTGYGRNTNKCNYFVYDVGIEAGAKMPTRFGFNRNLWTFPVPVGAGASGWGQASTLSYWRRVTSPKAGDIVAGYWLNSQNDRVYHVGIYIDRKNIVSANSKDIGSNANMFSYEKLVYWRYEG